MAGCIQNYDLFNILAKALFGGQNGLIKQVGEELVVFGLGVPIPKIILSTLDIIPSAAVRYGYRLFVFC
jgi:hypothetical protein